MNKQDFISHYFIAYAAARMVEYRLSPDLWKKGEMACLDIVGTKGLETILSDANIVWEAYVQAGLGIPYGVQ